jgi:SH3 domain protein
MKSAAEFTTFPIVSKLLIICILFTSLSIFSTTRVEAEDYLYVKPSSEVVIRTGKGTEFKIVAMVKDGTSVEFLEEDESYLKVRLANGAEGWMLKRFLSEEPPLSIVVETLRNENSRLSTETTAAAQKTEELSEALIKAQKEVTGLIAERNQFKNDYGRLAKDTADVVKIKQNQKKTAQENSALTDKLFQAEQENDLLNKDKTRHWFLAGAGVFLIGILFGKMPGPSRRKKSSLM